jgi:hypothetical protein
MDSTTDLNCKNGIAHYGADDMEPTHNRSVEVLGALPVHRIVVGPPGVDPPRFAT